MSLERIQSSTNRQRVDAGNLSASNDPSQWGHDGREQLIKGAELAAAGKTLGMSEEETLAAVSRQYRRQRRADDRVTPQDVVRQMAQSMATVRETAPEEIKGVSTEMDMDTAFAQGEDVEYFKRYRETRADDEQTYRADDRGYMEDDEGAIVRKPAEIDRPTITGEAPVIRTYRNSRTGKLFPATRSEDINLGYEEQVAPNSVLRDALSAVEKEKANRSGLTNRISRVFGGNAGVDAELDQASEALRRHLTPEAPQDARIGRAMVRKDNQRFDPEAEEANYYRAEANALQERDRLYGRGGYGRQGDINLGRVRRQAEIHGDWFKGENFERVFGPSLGIESEVARRSDGVYLDPVSGNPVAVQGPESPNISRRQDGGSTIGSADGLNAPQTARSWLAQNLDETLDGLQHSERLEQVDITQATTTAANKVSDYYKKAGIETTKALPSNIRRVEELQNVVTRVLNANNGQLTVPDLVKGGGAQTGAQGREVEAALTAIGLRPGEQRQLAQAMYQMDAARRSSVNENPTGIYLSRTGEGVQGPAMRGSQTRSFGSDGQFTSNVQFDSGTEMTKGISKADVARIPRGSTIGVRVENPETGTSSVKRRNIVNELAQLPSPDAARPFMGQVAGEKPRVNRYTRTGESDPVDAAISIRKTAEERAKGKEVDAGRTRGNQVRAMLITEREKRDNTRRAEQASELIAQLPPNARRTRLRGR